MLKLREKGDPALSFVIRKRGMPLDVLAAAWFTRKSGFIQFDTHILWLWGDRGFPVTHWPRYFIVTVIYQLWDVEWDERWGAWPHCCTQGGCWMHLGKPRRWCQCICRWCKFARLIRRKDVRYSDCRNC